MSKRRELLDSIAKTIADYRKGEIAAPDSDHVDAWIQQFDNGVQIPMLTELLHVLGETYISRVQVREFLSGLIKSKDFASDSPRSFWKNVSFLSIQEGGNSQREMLEMFDEVLQEEYGLEISMCGKNPRMFIYLDDGIFTGNRVRNDLTKWIRTTAPEQCEVRVVVIALHRGGQYYAGKGLDDATEQAGKEIKIGWWRCVSIEDRKTYIDTSDVLRPVSLPDDDRVRAYARSLKYPPTLRRPGNVGENKFFSSEWGRNLLEQELLKAGVSVREHCPYLNIYQRPLGNMILETLGFGTMIVTFRNCPNNCPLAFWAGDPWYPLFPRKTN
jgi:hypothetical protein